MISNGRLTRNPKNMSELKQFYEKVWSKVFLKIVQFFPGGKERSLSTSNVNVYCVFCEKRIIAMTKQKTRKFMFFLATVQYCT